MHFPHGETVTRLRATAVVSPYSSDDTDLDWSTPNSLALEGCAVWSGPTSDALIDARDMVDSDFTVAAPADSDVTTADRLVIRGLTCTVVGRPFSWRSPFSGWTPGTIIQANVVEG